MVDQRVMTFLFSDLVGSSTLWEADPAAMSEALVRHDTLMTEVIGETGGLVFKHVGDGICATFDDPIGAVAAAVALQRRLVDDPVLSLRTGIHVGAAEERDGDWFGTTLNRCARIMGIGHGGQILISDLAAALVKQGLPDEIHVAPLATVRLKGLAEPELVHQVNASGLRTQFPALAQQDIDQLPRPRTSLVGRSEELATLTRLLADEAVLTLTGVGGTGKTRLAIELARTAGGDFPDGVLFVPLAETDDAEDIAGVIAASAGVVGGDAEGGDGDLMDAVVRGLSHRSTLLVVDNCEHLLDPLCDILERILDGCPSVKVVATSREPLGVEGERVYRVPALDPSAGVQLMVDRAKAHDARFALSAADASRAEELCRRLDGLPLAIELAAARLRTMPLDEILRRLGDRFSLLAGRGRSRDRHATLRATLDWSYNLLRVDEQCLLARLSIFVGGFSMDGAEVVCSEPPLAQAEILDLLEALIDKSLVVVDREGGVSRYRLLETVRSYAGDHLGASGDIEQLSERHAEWVLALAGEFFLAQTEEETLRAGPFVRELDNARAASAWAIAADQAETAAVVSAALALALTLSGGAGEALRRCEDALALSGGSPLSRTLCELAAARAAQFSYDAESAWRHSLAALEVGADEGGLRSWMWNTLAMTALTAPDGADPSFEVCIAQARDHTVSADQAFFDFLEGLHRVRNDQVVASVEMFEQALQQITSRHPDRGPANLPAWYGYCLVNLAQARFLASGEGDLDDRTIAAVEDSGDVVLLSELRRIQVMAAAAKGESTVELLSDALQVVRNAGLPIGTWLDMAASGAWIGGRAADAVRLWGARGEGLAWTGEIGHYLQPKARTLLGEVECQRLYDAGAALSDEQAIAIGLESPPVLT